MYQLADTKSLLAKLMATENLIVEQRKVHTASFDVKNRVLTIPQLDKNISGYLFDMFIGHEVGHALFTPADGLKRAYDLGLQSVANLVEDSRIERKIKTKYPGIRSSFVKGYKELIEKDFFGTKGVNLNTLPFLDRLNLYEKGGPSQGIIFSPQERELLALVQTTETYDDVLEVSKKLMTYAKKEKEEMKQKSVEAGLDKEEQYEDSDYEDDIEGEIDTDYDFDGDDAVDYNDESDEKREDSEVGDGADDSEKDNDEIRSTTDEIFKQNQTKLYALENTEYAYCNLPTFNVNEFIISYKEIIADITTKENQYEYYNKKTPFKKFRLEANKVVSYLAKEFELRKNADQMKRASIAKTGELNINRLYSYQFSEDLFKKITVMPGGKSHGLVMFLDWSGSMHNHMLNTVKQLLSLILFCKKVNIPYEVYAFSSEYKTKAPEAKLNDLELRHFSLLNLFSSRMAMAEFTKMANTLLNAFDPANNRQAYYIPAFAMGGTPLNEAIISAMDIVPEFQKKYKERFNVVLATNS